MNVKQIVVNPILYLTLACYVGEATLSTIGIPIGINASVMYLLFFISMVLIVNKNIRKIQRMDIISILYLYIIIRNFPSNITDAEAYWLPNLITFFMIVLLCKCKIRAGQYSEFFRITYGFLLILMVLGIVKAILVGGRLAVFGGPNGFYKFCMLFHSLSFTRLLFEKNRKYIIGMALGIILALLTGSKGAIISILVLIPLEYYIFVLQTKQIREVINKFLKVLFVILVLAIIGIFLVNKVPALSNALNRAMGILGSDRSKLTSVSSRVHLWELSIDYFKQSPIIGKGARYLYYDTLGSGDPQPYAHNVFFEMLGEQGIIGFTLFLLVIYRMLRAFKGLGIRNKYAVNCFLGFIVYFIGAQFSGNILDTKMVLFYAEMMIVLNNGNLYDMTDFEDNAFYVLETVNFVK